MFSSTHKLKLERQRGNRGRKVKKKKTSPNYQGIRTQDGKNPEGKDKNETPTLDPKPMYSSNETHPKHYVVRIGIETGDRMLRKEL